MRSRHASVLLALTVLLAPIAAPLAAQESAPAIPPPPPTGATAVLFGRLVPALLRLEVLESRSKAKVSVGSGFYAAADGRVITNFHVISRLVHEPSRHTVRAVIGGTPRELRVLAIDVVHDLAVLQTNETPSVFIAPEARLVSKGTRVLALGHPLDLGPSVVEGTHNGYVEHSPVPLLHYTGPINPGMSGGPAVTEDGKLVGVNVATAGDEVGFLVPAEMAYALLARAPAAPPSSASLRRDLAAQLGAATTAALGHLFGKDVPTVVLDGFRVPTQADSIFRCWGDTDRYTKKRYEVARHGCSTDANVFLSNTLSASFANYNHSVLRADDLNPIAARTAMEEVYNDKMGFDGTTREVTPFSCTTRNVRANQLTWRAEVCVRRYRHLPNIYEAVLHAATLGSGKRGVVTTFVLSGVPFALIKSLVPRYLGAFGGAS